jgi:hypothetical protein
MRMPLCLLAHLHYFKFLLVSYAGVLGGYKHDGPGLARTLRGYERGMSAPPIAGSGTKRGRSGGRGKGPT